MTQSRPFSKLKKKIESLFVPELKMQVNCISYPVKSQYGSSSIPRFYVQLGKETIWDFPKDFPIKDIDYHFWKDSAGISDLIREYIDTPILELQNKKFNGEQIRMESTDSDFYLGLTDIFIAADRRIGKEKLMKYKTLNPIAKHILAQRFKVLPQNKSYISINSLPQDQKDAWGKMIQCYTCVIIDGEALFHYHDYENFYDNWIEGRTAFHLD